ncbi:MAG: tryptophan-rich sensory protein [Acidiferrobacterales bacterium]|nr:tryptophan-rich sensory protein [Acidiferrobacterales bacterium]
MKQNTKQWLMLPIFIFICYLVAYLGSMFAPGEWYENLNKAPWTPPNLAFPIVWGILYFFIAMAGWRIFINNEPKLKALWTLQLILNAIWSWVFFGQHWIVFGLIDLLILVSLVAVLILRCWRQHLKITTFLLIPYFIWLCIATSLNIYILLSN